MALTTNHENNELVKYRRQVIFDFMRASRFDPYMGDDASSIIVRMNDLAGDGKEINIPLINQLTGAGTGAATLRGNEEQLDTYGMPIWADWARNAVNYTKAVAKENSFSIGSAARNALGAWSRRTVRDDLVTALLSIPTATIQANRFQAPGNRVNGVKWADATTSQKNAWGTANQDRVLFGSAVGNYSTTFATAVGNVDSTADKMSTAVGSLAKDLAKQSGVDPDNPGVYNGKPKITPWQIKNTDQEWYVCFLGSRAFRDLKADTVMVEANREARARENSPTKNNPIFTDGALVYDGVIYREIPEITQLLLLKGVGASSIDVEPFFLCGQGALAYASGQVPKPTELEDGDYGFVTGMGIEAQYGVGKIAKAPQSVSGATVGDLVDWGMVTGFVAGVANA